MENLHCPCCNAMLEQREGHIYCSGCQRHYLSVAHCPECHNPLDVLKACGAVDYFCRNGHGLISKKRVEFRVVPDTPTGR